MADYIIEAKLRQGQGKGYASKARRAGRLPGVIYGPAAEPLRVEMETRAVELLYRDTLGKNALLTMKLDRDGKVDEQTVMFKDLQREPVKSKPLHVDFYHVDPKHPLNLDVPVVLEGTAAGVKEGGILEHGVRNIHVRCLPEHIPSSIHVDISNLNVEENILLQDITPPEGVTFLTDAHAVLAHVAEVKEEEAKPAEGEAGAAEAKPGEAKPEEAKAEEKKDDKK